ncbi:MAG: F0F1 ATP synthase subunit gamma [Verrucomicrobiota bacterium]|nr:F0F1 ATP synthase subunit gamma [Verrucomicrobiota bacterium]
MQLSEIRKKLRFQTELLNLIDTLKNIAASQYHFMEKEKERFDRFMDAFAGFFRVVNLVEIDDPLVRAASDVQGIVVVTSDSGFMGGLNQGVLRAATEIQGDRPDTKVSLVVIGDKGATALGDHGRAFRFFNGIDRERIYEQAVEIKDFVVREVLQRRMGKVVVVYPKPVSFASQTIETINLLPCAELFDVRAESAVAARVEGRGFMTEARRAARRLIVESSLSDMLEYLAGVWVTSKLYEIFEDSKLAEFSARAMHLEGSFDKVQKEQKKIKHQAFKAAHEQIDKGIRESFAGTKSNRAAHRQAG